MADLASIKDAIARVKGALDRKGEGAAGAYLLKDGTLSAASSGLSASVPFPWDGDAIVPGAEFEAIVDVLHVDPKFSIEGEKLMITAGRFKSRVKLLPPDSATAATSVAPPSDGATPLTQDDLDRFRALEPFVSDEPFPPWMNALILQQGRASAIGPKGASFAMAPVTDFGTTALLPKRALSIVLAASPAPTSLKLTDGAAIFYWDDGSWMRAGLVTGKIPGAVDGLAELALAGASAPEIDPDWRAAFDRVSALAKDSVMILPDKIIGESGASTIEEFADMPGAVENMRWSSVLVRIVMKAADRWDLTKEKAPFSGPFVKGIATGKRA